jgi:hypothetical protein
MRRASLLVLVLAAAGCGGGTRVQVVQPKLPRALAQDLRTQTAAVEAALSANDGCTARARAVALQSAVIQAVQSGRVPRRFEESLQSAANELVDAITCTPAPAPAPKPHGHGKPPKPKPPKPPKPHGHGKHKP